MTLSNFKIGFRLKAAFSFILVLMIAMIIVGINGFQKISAAKDDMRGAAHKHVLSEQWRGAIQSNAVRTYALVKSTNPADEAFFDAEIKATSSRITAIQKELEPLILSPQGKALFAHVVDQRKVYASARDEAFALKKATGSDAASVEKLVQQKMVPAINSYVGAIDAVAAYQKSLVDNANVAIDATYVQAKSLLLIIGAAAVLTGAMLAWVLTRSIIVPLARAVEVAETVAKGDLTADITTSSSDEFGQLLNALRSMNGSLHSTVSEVRLSTDAIAIAAKEIAAGNMDLSSRTEEQASSLEETAASLEELTSTVRQNAEHVRQANTLAITASEIATRGGSVVSDVVSTMDSINASSNQIVDIISVIEGIAFQTNILALNAAVEAARAGDQGRGFAVVASEVRNLAQRSAAAAKEIKTLITASVEQVQAGGKLVDEAGITMTNIVASITRVTDIMNEIAHASGEQSLGIDQINVAIVQMDEVTQQNAALVEEAASAAAAMEDQAAALALAVSVFVIGARPDRGSIERTALSPQGEFASKPILQLPG